MRRAGWNPTRRNRNIGTAKSGHGLDNSLVIPSPRYESWVFWQNLRDPVTVEIDGLTILVEPCLPGFVHAVTVEDVVRMLALLPPGDVAPLRIVVLRQPTKKQRILSAVWGRLAYYAEFGPVSGPAIILDAQRPNGCIERPRSLSPDDAEEIDRLVADGHVVTRDKRWRIQTSPASTRATQIFRTLPHEVGHQVHYDREVTIPARDDCDAEIALRDQYFSKPEREKEDFAHRYAREIVARLSAEHRVPFPRIEDEASMRRLGLDPKWFGLS